MFCVQLYQKKCVEIDKKEKQHIYVTYVVSGRKHHISKHWNAIEEWNSL